MKYSVNIEIDRPIDEVTALFEDPRNMPKWMDGFQSIETLSGSRNKVGARSRLRFKTGKRELEMIETVLKRDPPYEYDFKYEAKGVLNIVKNRFEVLPRNRTRCINDQEFKFKGFMRVFALLMPGAFKKESVKYLENFKRFAEDT